MLFEWNEDTIRWFVDASNYTGYHRKLSEIIAPMLKDSNTLCDIGCGLGILDIYLSPYMQNITCIDINENALNQVKETVKRRNISNIQIYNKNCNSLTDSFDCILLSFFGSRNLDRYLPYCKKLIVIIGGENVSHMYPKKDKKEKCNLSGVKQEDKNNYTEVEKYLKKNHISYRLQTHILNFGQPFHTKDDTYKYVKNLASDAAAAEIDKFIINNLKIQDGEYPYFMSHKKEIGIFEIAGKL